MGKLFERVALRVDYLFNEVVTEAIREVAAEIQKEDVDTPGHLDRLALATWYGSVDDPVTRAFFQEVLRLVAGDDAIRKQAFKAKATKENGDPDPKAIDIDDDAIVERVRASWDDAVAVAMVVKRKLEEDALVPVAADVETPDEQ